MLPTCLLVDCPLLTSVSDIEGALVEPLARLDSVASYATLDEWVALGAWRLCVCVACGVCARTCALWR